MCAGKPGPAGQSLLPCNFEGGEILSRQWVGLVRMYIFIYRQIDS